MLGRRCDHFALSRMLINSRELIKFWLTGQQKTGLLYRDKNSVPEQEPSSVSCSTLTRKKKGKTPQITEQPYLSLLINEWDDLQVTGRPSLRGLLHISLMGCLSLSRLILGAECGGLKWLCLLGWVIRNIQLTQFLCNVGKIHGISLSPKPAIEKAVTKHSLECLSG